MDLSKPSPTTILDEQRTQKILKMYNLTWEEITNLDNTTYGNVPEEPACDFRQLQDSYHIPHGYLSLVVCIFGTIANLLNIAVLTRKEMNGSPINRILTGIAVADMLVMVEYIPFTVHQYIWSEGRPVTERYAWSGTVLVWFHSNLSVVIHNVSVWLTLTLAVWRFIMIKYHALAPVYCTMARCKMVIVLAYVGPLILSIPNFFSVEIFRVDEVMDVGTEQRNITYYLLDLSAIARMNGSFLYRMNIWIYSFILKLVPCIALTILTGGLVRELYKAEERSARLKNGGQSQYRRPSAPPPTTQAAASPDVECASTLAVPAVGGGGGSGHRGSLKVAGAETGTGAGAAAAANGETAPEGGLPPLKKMSKNKRKRNTDRTTRLLVAILILFLLTEFPQGIFGLLSAVNGPNFYRHCYTPLGDFMDAMALINSAINFILYCVMSHQFRKTCFKFPSCWKRLEKSDTNSTAELEGAGLVPTAHPKHGHAIADEEDEEGVVEEAGEAKAMLAKVDVGDTRV